jgi:predicted glycogen debranching enzyme
VIEPGRALIIPATPEGAEMAVTREWLLTNGLGGYASGTLSGVITRRHHGLLIAAEPAPLGRMMMLTYLWERVRLPDRSTSVLSGYTDLGRDGEIDSGPPCEFRLDLGLPRWRYQLGATAIEKTVLLLHRQNTVHVTYRLLDGDGPVRLTLRPFMNVRSHQDPVNVPLGGPYTLTAIDDRIEIDAGAERPTLRMRTHAPGLAFTIDRKVAQHVLYRIEESRGYEHQGDLWSPGYYRADLRVGESATIIASTEQWAAIEARTPEEAMGAERARRRRLLARASPAASDEVGAQLVLAADQFVVAPATRLAAETPAHPPGDEPRTVIAGYPWFTDWGRDTMISLEGLTLHTGRAPDAAWILDTFAEHVRDGLIPNLFPEGDIEGRYHTADATLWMFHALDRYLDATGDHALLVRLLPVLLDIVDHHVRGTRFGIGVDPRDGLLRQGAPGYQLTWMDAKVGDWVVTPRRGKAVEINALWYNALRLAEGWARAERGAASAEPLAGHAARARAAFNARFWNPATGWLFDLVDGEGGDDPACRPNQILAMSLRHPVLDDARWKDVLAAVEASLLTPVGLRSLAPGHRDYQATYDGDLRARDAAYHQGTVWPWLLGAYVDAWLRVHPGDRQGARRLLDGLVRHLDEACVGSVSEIFDAERPFTPRGCVAQAWSVAEMLRAWIATER